MVVVWHGSKDEFAMYQQKVYYNESFLVLGMMYIGDNKSFEGITMNL